MDHVTQLYRSQIGGASVINYAYTDMPWKLFCRDVYYFFVYAWALPWILWPAFTYGSGPLDELYPTFSNIFCVLVHFVLAVLQLLFLLILPLTVILPIWTAAAGIAGFMVLIWLICKLLNGTGHEFYSDEKYAKPLPEHAHEQWVFVNGVAVGDHWFRSNLNRLAVTFKRPILGIHNRTTGILFDVIECLIQRNFSYATGDVRIIYKRLKEIIYDPSKSKVVLILHSQGGIEGGLALDWLLQEIPQDLLSKLEVYTFGNAANHFNNPHRHASSQSMVRDTPDIAVRTFLREESFPMSAPSSDPSKKDQAVKDPPSLSREISSSSSMRTTTAATDRAISHVEHYAHSTDFVALWGVLHFATNHTKSPQIPRFLGRLFVRADGGGGHQFNQHYLDGMFPLKLDPVTREPIGADEDNYFMDEVIKLGQEGEAMANIREAFDITYAGSDGFGTGEIGTPVEVYGTKKKKAHKGAHIKVRDLSRLWSYRNGMSPREVPPMLAVEGGVPRMATM